MTQETVRNPDGDMPEDNIIMSINPEQRNDQLPPFPTDETTVIPPEEHRDSNLTSDDEKKPRFGLGAKIGAGALTVAAIGGAWFGFNNEHGNTHDERRDTTSSAPAKTEKDTSKEQVKATPLTVEKYKNNPEGLTRAYYDEWNKLQNAGMTRAEAKSDDAFDYDTTDDYVAHFTDPIDQDFRDTLYAPEDQLSQGAISNVTRFIDVHRTNATVAYQTQSDDEMYKRYIIPESVSVEKSPAGEITTITKWHGKDNRDKNHAASLISGVNPNEETGETQITWKDVDSDGDYEVVDVQPHTS